MPTKDDVERLMSRAYGLPDGYEKIAVAEEAVRLADIVGDERLSYDARMDLVDASTWWGRKDLTIVALSWCMAYADRPETDIDQEQLLWRQKWVLGGLESFCSIRKSQIVEFEDDLERRLASIGRSPRPVERLRVSNRLSFGDYDQAALHRDRWLAAPRDEMADCLACEHDDEVWYSLRTGETERAIEQAMPLIDGTKLGCKGVPHRTFYKVTVALLRLERIEEALEIHPRAMRFVKGKLSQIGGIVPALLLLVRVGDLAEALRLLDGHLLEAFESSSDYLRRNFFAATSITLEAAAADKRGPFRLRLPPRHPLYREDNTYNLVELAQWFSAEADDLAKKFDARNGNDGLTRWHREMRSLAGMG